MMQIAGDYNTSVAWCASAAVGGKIERMAAHSDAEGPAYTLGRPLLPDCGMRFDEVEASVLRLLELCARLRDEGGCVIVSADASSESRLYHALAVLSSRLRRRGFQTSFPGVPFSSRALPAPAGVSIVLDAPLRRWSDEWKKPPAGIVTIMAGLTDDWKRLDITATIDFSVNPGAHLRQEVDRWQNQFLAGNPSERIALLAAAAGCDLPAQAFPDRIIPKVASPVLDLFGEATGFWSAHGLYLANAALRAMWSCENARRATTETAFRLYGILADHPLVLERFEYGLASIVSDRTLGPREGLDLNSIDK